MMLVELTGMGVGLVTAVDLRVDQRGQGRLVCNAVGIWLLLSFAACAVASSSSKAQIDSGN
jgi:hypothetical protein